jgi:hypothetical protein
MITLPGSPCRSPLQRSLQRRRRVLLALVVAVIATFALALMVARPSAWAVQLIADVLLAGYVGVLLHVRNVAANVEMTHRVLGS